MRRFPAATSPSRARLPGRRCPAFGEPGRRSPCRRHRCGRGAVCGSRRSAGVAGPLRRPGFRGPGGAVSRLRPGPRGSSSSRAPDTRGRRAGRRLRVRARGGRTQQPRRGGPQATISFSASAIAEASPGRSRTSVGPLTQGRSSRTHQDLQPPLKDDGRAAEPGPRSHSPVALARTRSVGSATPPTGLGVA